MRALSIRQPYAELILRGVKTIEYRTRATSIIGERFWIYAAKKKLSALSDQRSAAQRIWSDDLAVPNPRRGDVPPEWMLELAYLLISDKLPTGVIVGSAIIEKCVAPSTINDPPSTFFEWHLKDVERATTLRKPIGHPQPVWFNPF